MNTWKLKRKLMKQQLHFKVKSSSQCCQSDRCIYMMLHGHAGRLLWWDAPFCTFHGTFGRRRNLLHIGLACSIRMMSGIKVLLFQCASAWSNFLTPFSRDWLSNHTLLCPALTFLMNYAQYKVLLIHLYILAIAKLGLYLTESQFTVTLNCGEFFRYVCKRKTYVYDMLFVQV